MIFFFKLFFHLYFFLHFDKGSCSKHFLFVTYFIFVFIILFIILHRPTRSFFVFNDLQVITWKILWTIYLTTRCVSFKTIDISSVSNSQDPTFLTCAQTGTPCTVYFLPIRIMLNDGFSHKENGAYYPHS